MPGKALIISLGAGLQGSDSTHWEAGSVSKLRAAAAAMLFRSTPNATLLFSGGLAHEGMSEAEAMKNYLMRHESFKITERDIVTENQSSNTIESARSVSALIVRMTEPPRSVTLVTSRHQLLRATRYFKAHGIRVRPIAAESVVTPEIRRRLCIGETPVLMRTRVREWVLRMAQLIDRKGDFVARVWEKSRSANRNH